MNRPICVIFTLLTVFNLAVSKHQEEMSCHAVCMDLCEIFLIFFVDKKFCLKIYNHPVYLTWLKSSSIRGMTGINFLSHSASLALNTLLMMSHSLIHFSPTYHSHPPSHIHCFIPGSKLTFSTNLFHHSLLAHTWTAFSDYTGPDLSAQRFFSFLVKKNFCFILGRAVD